MLKRVYRQRRRIFLGTCFAALALAFAGVDNPYLQFIAFAGFDGSIVLAGALFGAALLLMAIAAFCMVILLAPKGRRTVEVIALSFALFEGLKMVARLNDIPPLPDAAEYLPFLAFYTLISTVLEHDLPGRFGLTFAHSDSREVHLPVTADAAWAAIAPSRDTLGSYWTRTLARVTPRPDLGAGWVEAHFRMGAQGFMIQRQRRLVWEPVRRLVYDFEPETPEADTSPADGASGRFEATIRDLPEGGCLLRITHVYPSLSFGRWLMVVLDDALPGEIDAITARLTGTRDWSVQGWTADSMAARRA
jgi:hypothetical protein